MTSQPIVWPDELTAGAATQLAGAKMGRLAELRAAGVAVPEAFTVATEAFTTHCRGAGLAATLDEALAGLSTDAEADQLQEASQALRATITDQPVAGELAAAITDAYRQLCQRCGAVPVPTAVRSSAVGEDSTEASFAGMFDTYLGVTGAERVLAAVKACWASLFTPRALAYCRQQGIGHAELPLAVGVVELIPARASGVAFSLHPVTHKRDRVVIEGNWGWGESVVQGTAAPDHVEIGKSDRRVLRYDVAHKKVRTVVDATTGESREEATPADLADAAVLADADLAAIVDAVVAVEDHYGHPVDVEWVRAEEGARHEPIVVVQARPVTSAPAEQEPAASGWDPVAMATRHAFGGRT